ncbi:MAG: class I SAM-dependent methyltransferase [Bacteriovoracaceae bacterium]|nr:class I SAM-dependent methyltransferase [Bacteriovoracaceae bacterium]
MSPFILYLEQKIQSLLPMVEARRLYHGRGKEFDDQHAFTLDYFPPGILLMTSFTQISIESLSEVLQYFRTQNFLKVHTILWQKRGQRELEFEVIEGTLPERGELIENGLKYAINFGQNQNLGFFLDMRLGREWVAQNAMDKTILNLFSYTCSFSTVALKHGAHQVINVDMADGALRTGERNHRLNGLPIAKAKFLGHDIFKSWGKIARFGPYDLIILDPPYKQSSFSLEKDFDKVMKRMPGLLSDRGKILVAINSPHHNWHQAEQMVLASCPNEFLVIDRLSSPPEFVETVDGAELKIFILEKNN